MQSSRYDIPVLVLEVDQSFLDVVCGITIL
jgi:hypothetical protein